jgi:DNA ligase-associated metallophosphoesterase
MLVIPHQQGNNTFYVTPSRCLFWEQEQALIVSDLHLGKTAHFRKAGIALPNDVFKDDLQRLFTAIQHFKPQYLVIVGDMGHSKHNTELTTFARWRNDMPQLPFHLVRGNHDILADDWYRAQAITVHETTFTVRDVIFSHDVLTQIPESYYNISGHIHPGILLKGGGRQKLAFPCFYFGTKYAVLPAFSAFTGLAILEPAATDAVYAVVQQAVVKV